MAISLRLEVQILLVFVGVLLLGNIIGGVVTIVVEDTHVAESTSVVIGSLSDASAANLQQRLNSLALTVALFFNRSSNDVTYQHDYAVKVFTSGFTVLSFYDNFNVVDYPSPAPGGLDADGISMSSSFWYKHTDLSSNPNLNESSLLDNSHGPMVRSNAAYVGMYMGFEDDLWRHFPYMNVGNKLQTNSYTCVSTGLSVTGYFPTCRIWYYLAKNNRGVTQYTDPYADASTGHIMITLARAVEPSGTLLGVVAADLSLDSLSSVVRSAVILDSGYAFICDKLKQVIIHPAADDPATIYTVVGLEFGEPGQESATFEVFLDDHVMTGESGQSTFTKGGDPWSVTYGPVAGTPYFVLMVVPVAEVVEAATAVETYAVEQISIMIAVVVVICTIIVAIGGLLAHRVADLIVQPILVFTKVLEDTRAHNMGDNMGDIVDPNSAPSVDDIAEVSSLRNKINNLFLAIKFATDAYHQKNYAVALSFLQEVQDMFTVIDQQRALGVIYNNRGNILRKSVGAKDNFISALKYLDRAVKGIEHFSTKAGADLEAAGTGGGDEIRSLHNNLAMFEKVLAARMSNHGDCLREAGRFHEAAASLDESYRLYEKHEDMQGMLQTMGNRGLVKLDLGEFAAAEAQFTDALEMADVRFKADVNYETAAGVQFASMNMGSYYHREATIRYGADTRERTVLIEKALSFYYYALTVCERVHKAVQIQCVLALAGIYKQEYGEVGAAAVLKLADMYPAHSADISSIAGGGVSNVNYLIDVSASMWGSRIKATVRVLNDIVQKRMKPGDKLTMDSFAKELKPVVSPTTLNAENVNSICTSIDGLIPSCTVGRTYFYSALVELGGRLVAQNPTGPHVVIALTDGEDNERRTTATDVKGFFVTHKIKLVIVSVGVDEPAVVASLQYLATSIDLYIKAQTDAASIVDALMQGFELATTSGNVVMEAF